MNGAEDPATGDHEQLERYLKWQSEFRRRAARRRRRLCYVAAVFVCVAGLGLATWRTEQARDARGRVVVEPLQAAPKSGGTTSGDPEPRGSVSAPSAGTVVEQTARRNPRGTAREMPRREAVEPSSGGITSRPLPPRPSSLPSRVFKDPGRTLDVAAGLPVADGSPVPDEAVSPPPSPTSTADTPLTVFTAPLLEDESADRSETSATVTPTSPAPEGAQPVPRPPSVLEPATAAVTSPAIPDARTKPGCGDALVAEAAQQRGGPGQRHSQAMTDCLVGWLKGEVQEFRSGAKREISEFRSGFDTVRRALQRLGSKVRSTE
jgi:hypothetical protein